MQNQSITYKNGGHSTTVKLLDNADNQCYLGLNYFYPYGASVSIEAPVITKYAFYSGRRPMVDFGTEYFTNANMGLRINNTVTWKSFGDLGNSGAVTQFNGYSSLSSQHIIQVNISPLQGKYYNAFSGKLLHC